MVRYDTCKGGTYNKMAMILASRSYSSASEAFVVLPNPSTRLFLQPPSSPVTASHLPLQQPPAVQPRRRCHPRHPTRISVRNSLNDSSSAPIVLSMHTNLSVRPLVSPFPRLHQQLSSHTSLSRQAFSNLLLVIFIVMRV